MKPNRIPDAPMPWRHVVYFLAAFILFALMVVWWQ